MKKKLITIGLIVIFLKSSVFATGNKFVVGGIPATDREWNGQDYLLVFQMIQTGKVLLPVLTDKDGLAVITRLTTRKNFELNKNKSIPVNLRLQDFLQLMQGQNGILKIYLDQANKGKDLHAEVARLLAFGLYISELGIELMNEFIPTIPKDGNYEVRMQGVKQMYSGMTTAFAGTEVSLTEREFYSSEDFTVIIKAMHSTLPTLKQGFSQEYMMELKTKLDAYKKRFKRNDAELIQAMIDELVTEQGSSAHSNSAAASSK